MSRRRISDWGYAPAKLPVKRDIAIFPILLSLQTASNNIPSQTRTKQESNSQRKCSLFLLIHGVHTSRKVVSLLLCLQYRNCSQSLHLKRQKADDFIKKDLSIVDNKRRDVCCLDVKWQKETEKQTKEKESTWWRVLGGWSVYGGMAASKRRATFTVENIDRPTFLSTALTINEYPHSFSTTFTYFPPPDNINKALIILAEQL
jgi:hypothetical protein